MFEPLYFKEKLIIHNPEGHIGIVTCWSDKIKFYEHLKESGQNIDDVAIIGNLFGNGIRELLRNLVYNPQIMTLIITGRDRTGAGEDLFQFFDKGFDLIDGDYYTLNGQLVQAARISTRNRIIDSLVKPYDLQKTKVYKAQDEKEVLEILKKIPVVNTEENQPTWYRQIVQLPQAVISIFPSNPRDFNITEEKVLDAWKELLFVLDEFGELVHLEKGDRKELQNVKIVVENPEVDERIFEYHWITKERLHEYQKDIFSPEVIGSYSYGNRIHQYFGIQCLEAVIRRLKKDPEDRQCYVTLWADARDLLHDEAPCLVSLFFRKFKEKLTCTATFRTHNGLDAWLYNIYGIKAILDYVSKMTEIPAGAITIMSHSISIDTGELGRAKHVIEDRHFRINLDYRGYFTFEVDQITGEIICKRFSQDDVFLKEYRAYKAEKLQHMLYKDHAVSDINHAMYIGRELANCERSRDFQSTIRNTVARFSRSHLPTES